MAPMPTPRKTIDVWRLKGNYGGGWEEIGIAYNRWDAAEELKEYRDNAPQYSYTIETGREPTSNYTAERLAEINKENEAARQRQIAARRAKRNIVLAVI